MTHIALEWLTEADQDIRYRYTIILGGNRRNRPRGRVANGDPIRKSEKSS
jgi:hypothetical protein